MFAKLNYVQKNKLLPAAIIVLFIICWFLSIDKTYEAIKLHTPFNSSINSQDESGLISFNPVYSKTKLNALNAILQSYKVDKKRWSNDSWLTVSSLALSMKVNIDYTATNRAAEIDSTSVGVKQSFSFLGDYVQLVRLIDTLEHTPKIGQISEVQVKTEKGLLDDGTSRKCRMHIILQGY